MEGVEKEIEALKTKIAKANSDAKGYATMDPADFNQAGQKQAEAQGFEKEKKKLEAAMSGLQSRLNAADAAGEADQVLL